jgi:hypothetical protein
MFEFLTFPARPRQFLTLGLKYASSRWRSWKWPEKSPAQQLASVYGIDCVRDDRALMLEAALRRQKYLQYDDLLPGSIPPLISRREDLRLGFVRLLEFPHIHRPFVEGVSVQQTT